MASINYAVREISVKIVYYGPGLSGKTTNLQVIHRKIPIDYRSDMVSLATETDRTLFFDFLPLDLGKIKGFSTKFQLYTVPGQVYYNATRKLVLRGVDGVVFVVDSAQDKMQENLESFQNLQDNLAEYGYQQGSVPIVLQYNKRDLPNALPVDIIDKTVNKFGYQWNEAVASQGKGVFESLKIIGKIVIDTLNRKYSRPSYGAGTPPPAAPQPRPQQAHKPAPAADQFYTQQNPVRQPPSAAPGPFSAHAQPQQDIFRAARPPQQAPQAAPRPAQAQQVPPPPRAQQEPPAQQADYYDYGSINLEPMTPNLQQQSPAPGQKTEADFSSGQAPSQTSADKTELDLEIEKYQREIEDKQRRLRNLQSAQPPQQAAPVVQTPPPQQTQPMQFPAPQKGSYDVYEPPESDQEQIPQYPPQQSADDVPPPGDEDQPLYFTSVNTDRQRKKIKRPINPKTRPQGGFLGKLFNKDKPQ
jgi:signal recognition particle receptor subunit beta